MLRKTSAKLGIQNTLSKENTMSFVIILKHKKTGRYLVLENLRTDKTLSTTYVDDINHASRLDNKDLDIVKKAFSFSLFKNLDTIKKDKSSFGKIYGGEYDNKGSISTDLDNLPPQIPSHNKYPLPSNLGGVDWDDDIPF